MAGLEILPIVTGGVLIASVGNQLAITHGPRFSRWWRRMRGCSCITVYKNNLSNPQEWMMLLEHMHDSNFAASTDFSIHSFTITDSSTNTHANIDFNIPIEPFTFQIYYKMGSTKKTSTHYLDIDVDPVISGGIVVGFEFWTNRWGWFSNISKANATSLLEQYIRKIRNVTELKSKFQKYMNPEPKMVEGFTPIYSDEQSPRHQHQQHQHQHQQHQHQHQQHQQHQVTDPNIVPNPFMGLTTATIAAISTASETCW